LKPADQFALGERRRCPIDQLPVPEVVVRKLAVVQRGFDLVGLKLGPEKGRQRTLAGDFVLTAGDRQS